MRGSDSILKIMRLPIATTFLFFLILAAYSNTFNAAWQMDDKPNIINNDYLHLKDLKPESLIQALYTNPTDPSNPGAKLYRPISFLTFALNWYIGKDNVIGYHIANLLIHFLTSVFLFLAILNILQAPGLSRQFERNKYLIAFISAALWSLNPIQTQAVTYIVQRMASMAAMFYILSMLLYIKCRLSRSSLHRILLLSGCALSFLMALGSKENAAMLPASLLLIEVTCFQEFNWWYNKKSYFWGSIAGGLIILLLGIWFFNSDITFSFLNGYQNRPFTLSERLLTEPRIVLYYLSQIFYPVPTRLSVEHDVVIATSLFQPWTTLPAILLTLLIIGFGISQVGKRPLSALAILFFFLNHIIESTVIPLELIFEHRNYLPSMFLFLPITAGFQWLYGYCSANKQPLCGVLTAFLVLLIVSLGAATYARNIAWATETSLWRDAMKKAPQSARPLTNLAWKMAYGPGARASQYDEALKLYEKALSLQKPRLFSDSIIMNNMAGIYFKQGEHQKAIDLLESALIISPDYTRGRYDLARILIVSGKWNVAADHIEYLLAKDDAHERYLNLKGLVLVHQKKYDTAIHCFRKSLTFNPFLKESLMNLGIAYSLKGNYRNAESYLIRAHQVHPKNMIPLMGLIENRLRAADFKGAQKYAGILSSTYRRAAIKNQLQSLSKDHLSLFLSAESISAVIENQWAKNSQESSEDSN
ncbi:tetratricopeptide repeat protein [Thermodesulfobacteriota bacterium]